MNRKIVFSLVLLSAFSYANAENRVELQIGIVDTDNANQHSNHLNKCINSVPGNRSVDGLNDCAKLRKMNDKFYVQCFANPDISDDTYKILSENSSYFHLINILTQKGDVVKNPEKVRYEALRQCGVSYFDARMYSAYKMAVKYTPYEEATKFVNSYRDNVIKKKLNEIKNTDKEVCKKVFEAELNYINNSQKGLDDIDYDPYYAAVGFRTPEVQNFSSSKTFSTNVKLKSDLDGNDKKKFIEEYYKEFHANTTGRVIVSSSPTVINSQYLVYLLDQNEFAGSNGWVYRNFSNVVGDKTNAGDIQGMKGCSSLSNVSLTTYSIASWDVNKLIFVNENYNNSVVLGVCDVYNKYLELNNNPNTFAKDRALEAIILKNSKIKPFDYGDLLSDYNDNKNGNRVNDYAGGVSKCYNYDLEHYSSQYSRANYFDYLNQEDFRKDDAKEIVRKNYVFSIHKNNTTRKGIVLGDDDTYNFSVNVRPSFVTNKQYNSQGKGSVVTTQVSNLAVKFIPDANYYQITNEANQTDKKDSKPLKVTNLDDVYIALNNSKTPFNAEDRKANNISVKYYLTSFELTKQRMADANGAVDSKEEKISVNSEYELVQKENITGFGLKFTKDTFKKLAKIDDNDLLKGNVYKFTFKPLEIVEEITETNREEVCPSSGACKIQEKTRKFRRPMFQASGVDIVKGAPKGSVEIILGHSEMPNGINFGTAYNNIDATKILENNKIASNTKVADKIYTRTSSQDIYLGFTKPDVKVLYKQYIKFYNGSDELNADIYNGTQKLSKSTTECKGYYPIDNKMVLHLKDKLAVNQNYQFRYEIAEYDSTFEECSVLGDRSSNTFSIRPDSITYKVGTLDTFDKKAGKEDKKYPNNNVTFTADLKDDRFGISVAELKVSDSKGSVKKFYLEDKNSVQLNQVGSKAASRTFVDFNKTNGNFDIKTVFPLVTDAQIAFSENKFTIGDLEQDLCVNSNVAVDITNANKINSDGKINCQTPGNELTVNFIADETLGLQIDNTNMAIRPYLTNTSFTNYVPFSDNDSERLALPLQVANKNTNNYFYKKFANDDATININLGYDPTPNVNKVIIKADSETLGVTATSGTKGGFKVTGLNSGFDNALSLIDPSAKLSTYDDSKFSAKEFGKILVKIGYPKYDGTKPNLDPKFLIKSAEAEIKFNGGGSLNVSNLLTNPYEFAFTGLFFKDLNKNTGTTRKISETDAWVFKYDNNKFVKMDSKNLSNYSKVYNDAKGGFSFISDYSKKEIPGDTYEVPTNLENNQYIKDTLRFRVKDKAFSYLDSDATFTIEFVK
ncbi:MULTISPECIES: hypothetical protein [unclassified Campylobacter]|uniref:hypothetical protein n=1 Tax=unclassified Campylobacter TaxID=2593542 RepID=UPI001EFA5699|nr:hypothetical protein [Campylobacter sp. RM12651]MBZ7976786.1 hypothetical protein [Campylobacter sp. RM12637]ULO03285.1 hypothetical protein AVBRAN_0823 [Campylobacter sp. RM12651]